MRKLLASGLILLTAAPAPLQADATLRFRWTPAGAEAGTLTIAIADFHARVESSAVPGGWWLFQAGKFFPLYRVDDAARVWTPQTRPVAPRLGPVHRAGSPAGTLAAGDQAVGETATASNTAAEAGKAPAIVPRPSRAPSLAPTGALDEVAGVRCRVVREPAHGEPVIEHCMANTSALGITEREIRTLARTFVMAREQGFGWLGAATADEEFVSIRSRYRDGGALLVLESVSNDALPRDRMRVPRHYREGPWQSEDARIAPDSAASGRAPEAAPAVSVEPSDRAGD